jgi:hypothetical protein
MIRKRDNSFKIMANFSRLLFAITNMLIPYISLCCNYLPLYTMHVTFYYFSANVFLNGQIFNLPPSSLSLSTVARTPHHLHTVSSSSTLHRLRAYLPPRSSVACFVPSSPTPIAHSQLPIGLSYTTSPPPRTCIVHRPTHPPSSLVIYPLPASSPSTAHTLPCGLVSHELNNMTRGKRRWGSFIFFTTIFEVGVFSSFSQYYKIEK